MRFRLGFLALAVLVLSPVAAAAEPTDAAPAKAPVGRVLDVVGNVLDTGAAAGATAASGAAKGADAAADGTVSLFTVLAGAAASAAAAGAAVAGAAGRALAAFGSASLDVAVLVGGALALGARAVGAFLLLAATTVGSLLASLFRSGAGWVAAHPREALYGTAAVGGTAAAGSLLYWLKRIGAFAPLAGLYTRLSSGEILDNEVRAKVFDEVRGNPGAHPSAIKEKLGLGWGTVVYHLDRLEETGLVTSRTGSGRKCYFVNGSGLAVEAQKATAALKHPSARAIADAVRDAPGLTQKALSERTGMSPALVSWHVRRLAAAGILAQERTSHGVSLRLAQPLTVAA